MHSGYQFLMGKDHNLKAVYADLMRRTREIAVLTSCSELLGWDEETYMPAGGALQRSQQLALLAGIRHEKISDPQLGHLIVALEKSELTQQLESPEAVNIRELRRSYDRRQKISRSLLEEIVRTTALAQREWRLAYDESNFSRFQPWLKKVVDLKRQEARALERNGDLYDGLLEDYEPGASGKVLEQLFVALRAELVPLLERISQARCQPDESTLKRDFPVDRQRLFARQVAETLGFDFKNGRIDETVHPFCAGIGLGDARVATRYSPDDFSHGLFAVIHEIGHAFYEQGLDPEHYGTPAGSTVSLGIHESQSRLWENLVGRSRGFWHYFLPLAQEIFGPTLADVTVDQMHFAVNAVKPTFIRTEADEVTYNLHVIVRFELERALINGDLEVDDLPAAWNERSLQYLGITPASDRQGCLQDCHWANGLFGYFPTYTLGNLYAAQLFEKASAELGDLEASFTRGEFRGLLEWLRSRVHRQGRKHHALKLIELATGKPPSPAAFVEGLKRKYSNLYRL